MSFFSGGTKQAKPQYTGIQLQTSASTVPVALLWGANRLGPNIFWYDDFQSHKEKQKTGKGFTPPGGVSYTYSASLLLGLCQGEISGVGRVFRDREKVSDYTSLGFTLFTGAVGQSPWGYLTANHPDQALSYSGIAYVAAANYNLGSSASTPQHGFEVFGLRYDTGPTGNGDADAALVVFDFLTADEYGAGFSVDAIDQSQLFSSILASTTGDGCYQTYCTARGFGLNPPLSSQEAAGGILERWARITDSEVVWTGCLLRIVPYGTEVIEANGVKYLPDVTPAYSLTEADFIGSPPLLVDRSDPADAFNSLKVTVRNRDNEYNDAPTEWRDQGLIDQYGIRQGPGISAPEVCSLTMGALIAGLIGQREAYTRNTYKFNLPPNFCLIEPMTVLSVEDPALGSVLVWVKEIDEGEDYSLQITADEIPLGVNAIGVSQDISNNPVNTGADPGPVNPPVIFQPPLELTSIVPQVWAAVSGGDGTNYSPNWGGAFVHVSTDGTTYQQIGQVGSAARQGKLSALLPTYVGSNPDSGHTLSVDMAQSAGTLESVSSDDAARFVTLCYVDGELVSFQDASLTGTNAYGLTTLYRGLYDSAVASHSSGSQFARLDANVFKYDLPDEFMGVELYFKFQSYNIWGAGLQDLADCAEYTFTTVTPEPVEVVYDGGDPLGELV